MVRGGGVDASAPGERGARRHFCQRGSQQEESHASQLRGANVSLILSWRVRSPREFIILTVGGGAYAFRYCNAVFGPKAVCLP